MEADEVDLAIDRYDRALAVGYEDQEGILLNLRSAAHLEVPTQFTHTRARAHTHKLSLSLSLAFTGYGLRVVLTVSP